MYNSHPPDRHFYDESRMTSLKAELSKIGCDVLSDSYGQADPDASPRKTLAELRRAVNQLNDRAQALIAEGKSQEAQPLVAAIETAGSVAAKWTKEIENRENSERMTREAYASGALPLPPGYQAADFEKPAQAQQSRQTLKLLSAKEPFPVRGEDPGFTVGQLMGAMANGGGNRAVRNALSEGVSSNGGVAVPSVLMGRIVDAMRSRAVVSAAGAQVMELQSDQNTVVKVEKLPTASWRAEAEAVKESDPTFSGIEFKPKSLACIVRVSNELLQDAIDGFEDALMRALGESLGLEIDRACLFGTGENNQPSGLINEMHISQYDLPGDGAALTSWDDVINLMYLMRMQNSWGENMAMISSPLVWKQVAQFKSQEGQPLRRPTELEGVPLLTSTIVPQNFTHGSSENSTVLFAGDFRSMVLGFRQNLQMRVLNELYASTLETAFLCTLRFDVGFLHPEEFGVIRGIIPAADTAVKATRSK